MCSSTRGPAMAPSLVTWPTSSTAMPRRLASSTNAWTEALGTQPHLIDRLFARDVGAGGVLLGERRRHLQQQGRLADAGVAADQQRRAHHQPAAAHAVEFADAAPVARRLR